MRILIVEGDYATRKTLFHMLSKYGKCDVAIEDRAVLEVFMRAVDDRDHYDLVCLDLMLQKIDGLKIFSAIRAIEKQRQVPENKKSKIILTATQDMPEMSCMDFGCSGQAFLIKPISGEACRTAMCQLGLSESSMEEKTLN